MNMMDKLLILLESMMTTTLMIMRYSIEHLDWNATNLMLSGQDCPRLTSLDMNHLGLNNMKTEKFE